MVCHLIHKLLNNVKISVQLSFLVIASYTLFLPPEFRGNLVQFSPPSPVKI